MAEAPNNANSEGPGKGKPFFDRAKTVADSGNYDYAIDMYIQGLNREPTLVEAHEALRRVAMERKVKGGKPAGGLFGTKLPMSGKTPKDKMLNAEFLLAKDPGNISQMLAFLRAAKDGGYKEVIKWFGPTLRLANKQKPKKDIYLELADMYRAIEEFYDAADVIQDAAELDPNDLNLNQLLNTVSAEATMKKARFDSAENFKESLADADKTKELLQEDALQKSREYRKKQVDQARVEYEAAPLDHRFINKYATALRNMEEESYEATAVEVLNKAFNETSTYQYKRAIDEIKIRQFRRQIEALGMQIRLRPEDAALKDQLKHLQAEQLAFELTALKDWSEHYPTDMTLMYEYAIRLYRSKHFDEAIGAFQQAQTNPRYRTESLYYLGLSFVEQKMLPEAYETFRTAVAEYEMAETGNDMSKRLYYALARVCEETARKPEAMEIYSKLTRWDIAYRDARSRLAALRNAG